MNHFDSAITNHSAAAAGALPPLYESGFCVKIQPSANQTAIRKLNLALLFHISLNSNSLRAEAKESSAGGATCHIYSLI